MKVVAWNVNQNAAALASRGDVAGADIYLLNETPPTLDLGGLNIETNERTVGRDCPHETGKCTCNRKWSAAVAASHELSRIEDARTFKSGRSLFQPSRQGSWIAAQVTLDSGEKVTAISVYGLLDEKSDASVHRSLSDLSPIFDHERYSRLLIMGGDLNTLARAEIGTRTLAKDQGVLDRITNGFGLVDLLKRDIREQGRGSLEGCGCGYGPHCEHTWTHVRSGEETTKYQDDYLFASAELAERLPRCEALVFTDASDHAPVVASSET